jgi:hypothetical protein
VSRPSFSAVSPHRGDAFGVDPDLPSGCGFIALLEGFRATGGIAPGEVVARLLEEHRAGDVVSLAKLICTGQVFGCEWCASLWIPMFQFEVHNLALKAGVQRVRAELPSLWSGWTLACWFAAPNSRLGGSSPADRLDTDFEAVMRAARSLRSDEDSLPAFAPERLTRQASSHV